MLDLHTHSNCSDGQHSPTELLALAAHNQITHLALTDHDTVSGLKEAAAAAKNYGIQFLCGIEISTSQSHQHLLGLGIDPDCPAMLSACEAYKIRRISREQGILKVLNGWGMDIFAEDVQKFAHGQVGRPHFARAMVEKGYVQSVPEAFERYLKAPEIRAISDKKPDAAEAIALIHEAGGFAVLAHPMELALPFAQLQTHMDTLLEIGLDGIEVFYQSNTAQEIEFLRDYAKKHNLLMTGGSDFHGALVKPSVTLGIRSQEEILSQSALWQEK